MGTSSSNTSQSSTTAPGAAAQPIVQGLTGALTSQLGNIGLTPQQQAAINQLTQNGANGNPYAPAIGNNANSLLAGGGAAGQNGALSQNLATLKDTLSPYTDPNYSTVNSPAVQAALQQANIGIANGVNSQFAAAGRSGSGYNTQTLAQGEEAADAPIILNQANLDTATRMGAANTLYGAGNTTSGAITGNNQTALGNQQAGVGAANSALQAQNYGPTAMLEAQQLGQQIPAQNLGMLANIGIPLAGLNTTSTGTGTTTTNPSLLSEITGGAAALGAGPSTGVNGATSAGSGIMGLLGLLSDRRLKEDICQVGTLFDGTPVYRYRYKGTPMFHIGLMADEVAPEAVCDFAGGFKGVEYKAATERAVQVAEAA